MDTIKGFVVALLLHKIVAPDASPVAVNVDVPLQLLTTLTPGAPGTPFIVRDLLTVVVPQLLVTAYLTVTAPAVEPVTTPPVVMLAEPVPFNIDQVPPPVASVKAGVVEPTHTVAAPPPIAATVGTATIVTLVVAVLEQVPLLKL